jgi:hypothetical protein
MMDREFVAFMRKALWRHQKRDLLLGVLYVALIAAGAPAWVLGALLMLQWLISLLLQAAVNMGGGKLEDLL